MIDLGHTYRDVITGFTGVATGRCEYITGCNQALLQPKGTVEKPRPEGEWFDDQRLELLADVPPIVLINGRTPGCDAPAPKR